MDTNQFDILSKYVDLLTEFLNFFLENSKIKNKNHLKFITVRGIETITHVFNTILYYTKNINITYLHCQKAYYFYVEFIGQISEDQNAFLQLSSKDATTYVYKKTIFEINNEYKKNSEVFTEEEINKFSYVSEYIILIKTILEIMLNNGDNKENLTSSINIDKFNKICNKIIYSKIETQNLSILHTFFELLEKKCKIDFADFCELIGLFLKKISKNTNAIKKIKYKLYEDDFETIFASETHDKFINWLLL
jgi:hypothetical protein